MNDTNEPQILRAIRERYADGLDLLPHQTRWLINQAEQLNDARAQKPVAWRPKFDIEGDWSLGEPSIESIEYWHGQGLEIEYAYLRAAPVPAQPIPR